MLCSRKYKQLIVFSLTMCGSAGISLLIFPAMWKHVFSGYRGTQSLDNLSSLDDMGDRLKTFYQILDSQIFGNTLIYFVVGATILLFLSRFFQKKSENKTVEVVEKTKKDSVFQWMILIFPVMAYFLLVSKSAVYLSDRYIYPFYAVVIFLIIVGFAKLVDRLIQSVDLQLCILVIISVVIIVGTWKCMDWPYLYRNEAKRMDTIEKYKGTNAIVVYDLIWKTQPLYPEITCANSSTFITKDEVGLLGNYKYKSDKELFVLITHSNQESVLTEIVEKLPNVNKYEKLGGFLYHTVYRLYGEGETCKVEAADGSVVFEDVYLLQTKDGYVNFMVNGQALDVSYATFASGTEVTLFGPNGTAAQEWKIQDCGDGTFCIESFNSEYCLVHDEQGKLSIDLKNEGNIGQRWNISYK